MLWISTALVLGVAVGGAVWYLRRLHRTPEQYAAAIQSTVGDYLAGKRSLDASARRIAKLQFDLVKYGDWSQTPQSSATISSTVPPGSDSTDPRVELLMRRVREVTQEMLR